MSRTTVRRGLKLPTSLLFAADVAALPLGAGYPTIDYSEDNGVGYLAFPFYNGAMGKQACCDLLAAYRQALTRPTRVLVLTGGEDFWFERDASRPDRSREQPGRGVVGQYQRYRRCRAGDHRDAGSSHRVGLRGNAGAGGFFLALAADEVWMAERVVANPHYKDMGNLSGSEYWTYLLPRRAAQLEAATPVCVPLARQARRRIQTDNTAAPAHRRPSGRQLSLRSRARAFPREEYRRDGKRRNGNRRSCIQCSRRVR